MGSILWRLGRRRASAQPCAGFQQKFGQNVLEKWADVWQEYTEQGWATIEGDTVRLTRQGLLRADALLPAFFEPEHRDVRYT